MRQAFTITDIETTGSGIQGNRITEISIFRVEDGQVVDEFTSLVNPGCPIPAYITGLTGIDDAMVRDAPAFSELAPDIQRFTEKTIFVAHSVNFDYHVIKNEFKAVGQDFVRKRLCTVRLSRRLFPGFRSYSLGKLCSGLEIPLENRHRARGDAMATVTLFQKILQAQGSETLIKSFLNARSQEATLPPQLPRKAFEELPPKPGVYYFINAEGKVIYVGKAKDLRKRVLSHFYDKSDKEVRMCRETTDIRFELSGSELLALLMESAAIKQLYPTYNHSQKRNIPQFAVFSYEDRQGIKHLAYNRIKGVPFPLISFYTVTDCRLFLEQLCQEFGLCAKYCHLQTGVAHCNHFRVPCCGGVCRGEEAIQDYNARVGAAIQSILEKRADMIIREKGRHAAENAIILIRAGAYCGYGFIGNEFEVGGLEDALAFIKPQKNTLETERLLHSYSLKHPENIRVLQTEKF